jgi:uncharacterized membrane protein
MTGLSPFRALQLGDASKVAPVDKFSVVVAIRSLRCCCASN